MASSAIKSEAAEKAASATLAKAIAPEDIRRGDFVMVLQIVYEVPSFLWCGEAWSLPPEVPVRMGFSSVYEARPLKVTSICLPFVFVLQPSGDRQTLDVRSCLLARLDAAEGLRAWRGFRNMARKQRKRKK